MNLLSSSYSSSYCDRIDREEFENTMSQYTDALDPENYGDCKFSVCGVDVGNLFLFDLKKLRPRAVGRDS